MQFESYSPDNFCFVFCHCRNYHMCVCVCVCVRMCVCVHVHVCMHVLGLGWRCALLAGVDEGGLHCCMQLCLSVRHPHRVFMCLQAHSKAEVRRSCTVNSKNHSSPVLGNKKVSDPQAHPL